MSESKKYASTKAHYDKLLTMLDTEKQTNEDVYTKLLTTEENVLNIANRVASSQHLMSTNDTVFYNQTMISLILNTANTWRNMFTELFVYKEFNSATEIVAILIGNDRKIYFGFFLCVMAFFLFFIDISSS
jgi:hypothetical protein